MSNDINFSLQPEDGDRKAAIRFIVETIESESAQLAQRITREALREVLDREGSFTRVAAEIIPGNYAMSADVSSRIISRTARLLLTPEEYRAAVRNSFSLGQRRLPAENFPFSNPEFRRKIAEEQGEKLWENNDEIDVLEALAEDPAFQHAQGTTSCGPDYNRIAIELNDIFWESEPYRNAASCSMRMQYHRSQRGEVLKPTFRRWSLKERLLLMQMVADPAYKHQGGSQDGFCDMDRIVQQLNVVNWSGDNIRTKLKCWQQVRYIRRNQNIRQAVETAGGLQIEPMYMHAEPET